MLIIIEKAVIGRVITSLKHLLWTKVFATTPCLILLSTQIGEYNYEPHFTNQGSEA